MKSNMGAFDGWFRTLLFILSVCYVVLGGSWIWLIPGSILFASAVLLWCPLYEIIGVSTNTDKEVS